MTTELDTRNAKPGEHRLHPIRRGPHPRRRVRRPARRAQRQRRPAVHRPEPGEVRRGRRRPRASAPARGWSCTTRAAATTRYRRSRRSGRRGLWWQLRLEGFDDVSVLDGGFRAGCTTDSRSVPASSATLRLSSPASAAEPSCRVERADVLKAIGDPATLLIDSRAPEAYRGLADRPYRSGHIPGAVNVLRGVELGPRHRHPRRSRPAPRPLRRRRRARSRTSASSPTAAAESARRRTPSPSPSPDGPPSPSTTARCSNGPPTRTTPSTARTSTAAPESGRADEADDAHRPH